MGSLRSFSPVKLFVGVLVSDASLADKARDGLTAKYGPIDFESPVIPFHRVFFSFERLIEANQLAEIKLETNAIEEQMKPLLDRVKRPVNLDPGYIESAKVILATTRNFYHRIYLSRGIFAEVTMHFKHDTFQFFPWTYPDYQSKEYQDFFLHMRQIYRSQLRNMCILGREEQP